MQEGLKVNGQGCELGWDIKGGMQRQVKGGVRDVASSLSWELEAVGEFLKSLLGLQDAIKKFAVYPLHNSHLNCFMILYHLPSMLKIT